jgi:hypothetical protein
LQAAIDHFALLLVEVGLACRKDIGIAVHSY